MDHPLPPNGDTPGSAEARFVTYSVNAHPHDLVDPWWMDEVQRRGLTEFLYRRWAVTLDAVPEAFDQLPDGFALRRRGALLNSGSVEAVAQSGDAFVVLQLMHGQLWAGVAAPDLASARGTLGRLTEAFPEVERSADAADPHILLSLWSQDEHARVSRRFEVAPWSAIAGNYSPETRATLDPLMSEDWRPDAAGRLLVWFGEPGTGKSFALAALAYAWREWASVHYIADPESLLNSPGYLLELMMSGGPADDAWRLVVLEDAGELFGSNARNATGQALSRLLNATDGMLGQGSRTLFVVTTNEPVETFHQAVVRPGRCAARVEFTALPVEQAKEWLVAAGGADVARGLTQPATVAELFSMLRGEEQAAAPPRLVGFQPPATGTDG